MRSRLAIIAVIALVAAGCAGSAGATPGSSAGAAPAGSPVAVARPTSNPTSVASPTTAPSGTPLAIVTPVSARVTFDGKQCVYTGPTVIPFPASLTVEYAPSDAQKASMIGLIAIRSGTTKEQLTSSSNPKIGEGTPGFVYLDSHVFFEGAGTFEYRTVSSGANPMADPTALGDKPYDTYLVMCIPAIPGYPAGEQTILHMVVPGA